MGEAASAAAGEGSLHGIVLTKRGATPVDASFAYRATTLTCALFAFSATVILSIENLPLQIYLTFPAEFSSTTFERIAVSDLSGRCEQKPMPT
jgi:hypothetical protein